MKRILALTGPAGSGKTASLRVLAKELDLEIVEWRNGMDDGIGGDYTGSDGKHGSSTLTC